MATIRLLPISDLRYLECLDAFFTELASGLTKLLRFRSSVIQSQTVSALSRVRHQQSVPFVRVRLRLKAESLSRRAKRVLGRQNILPTPWLTERHGYDPTFNKAASFPKLGHSVANRLCTF